MKYFCSFGTEKFEAAIGCIALQVEKDHANAVTEFLPSESQGRIVLILNFNQGVQVHRTTLLQVDPIGHEFWLVFWIARIRSINEELFHGLLGLSGQGLIKLFYVVDLLDSRDGRGDTLNHLPGFVRVVVGVGSVVIPVESSDTVFGQNSGQAS